MPPRSAPALVPAACMFACLAFATICPASSTADAEPTAPASSPASGPSRVWRPAVGVTRADLARAYVALDRAYMAAADRASMPGQPGWTNSAQRLTAHRAFDGLTSDFFTGNFASAVRKVNALHAELVSAAGVSHFRFDEPQQIVSSVKASITPSRLVQPSLGGTVPEVQVRLTSMYRVQRRAASPDIQPAANQHANLVLHIGSERTCGPGITIDVGAPLLEPGPDGVQWAWVDTTVAVPTKDLAQGWHELRLRMGRDGADPANAEAAESIAEQNLGVFYVLPEPLSTTRDRLERAVREAEATARPGDALLVRSRIALLVDEPSPNNSAEFQSHPITLTGQIEREIEHMRAGSQAFTSAGDWHLTLPIEGVPTLPMRVVVPKSAAAAIEAGRRVPVVIALHGAGGDENMFLDAYGAGRIATLAEQHGFIVLSPRTETIMGATVLRPGDGQPQGNAIFAEVLAFAAQRWTIDPARVYVVGHSMGAAAASALARSEHDRLAAVACIAGGPRRTQPTDIAPTLVIAAEIDPIIPAPPLRRAAEASAKAGAPVEFSLSNGAGHTLVVNDELPRAIDWLLARTLNAGANPAQKDTP